MHPYSKEMRKFCLADKTVNSFVIAVYMPMMCWRNGVLVNWKNDDLFSDVKTPYFPYYYIYVWHITRRTAANRSGPEMQKRFCISIKVYYIVGAKVPHSDSLQRYRATKGKPYTSHKTTKAKFHRPPPATGLHTEETLKRTKRKTSRRTAMAAAQWRF